MFKNSGSGVSVGLCSTILTTARQRGGAPFIGESGAVELEPASLVNDQLDNEAGTDNVELSVWKLGTGMDIVEWAVKNWEAGSYIVLVELSFKKRGQEQALLIRRVSFWCSVASSVYNRKKIRKSWFYNEQN